MERLTIPDKKIPGGTARAMIDARAVREEAMTIYWALKKYEDTGLTPEGIERLKEQHRWIPVEERLPEDGTYLCTLDGELCGLDEPFTGMCGIENGKWDEEGCVIAWQPLPEPYRKEIDDITQSIADWEEKVTATFLKDSKI